MTDMLESAKKIAASPPIGLYTKVMQQVSQHQLTDLRNAGVQGVELENARKVADNWNQMVNNDGENLARFQVGSICDFSAMCMMMIGAGSARSEALKAAIRNRSLAGYTDTDIGTGDRAWLFDRTSYARFLPAMEEWFMVKDNGIVQFKFSASGDFHTFAVERTPDPKGRREFIVYQSYEGTYTMSHFLNQTPVWEDDTLQALYEHRWSELDPDTKKIYKDDYQVYGRKVCVPKMDNIELAAKWTGSGQRHDFDSLYNLVLQPLDAMLSGTCSAKEYVRMTGSPSTHHGFQAPYIIALMCNKVSPNDFKANCDALYNDLDGVTEYASCGIKVNDKSSLSQKD